jgi:hypothetical protein
LHLRTQGRAVTRQTLVGTRALEHEPGTASRPHDHAIIAYEEGAVPAYADPLTCALPGWSRAFRGAVGQPGRISPGRSS